MTWERLISAMLFAAALVPTAPALAAGCSSPPGTAGDQFYNNTYSVMQFCNGTNWVNMGYTGATSGGVGAVTPNDFCTGSATNSVVCATAVINLGTQVTGALPTANGGTGVNSAFTSGSVLFAGNSGIYSQDNSNFFWDSINHRLGIGTTGPGHKLVVAGGTIEEATAGALAYFSSAGATNIAIRDSADHSELLNWVDSTGGYLGTVTNHNLFLQTNNQPRLTIDSSGNVGIGTTTPGTNLHVQGGSAGAYPIEFGYSGGSRYGKLYVDQNGEGFFNSTGTGSIGLYINDRLGYIGLRNGGTELLSVNSTGVEIGNGYINSTAPTNGMIVQGNVGIGTTSPATALQVNGTITATSISSSSDVMTGLGRGNNFDYNTLASASAGPGGTRWVDGGGTNLHGPENSGNTSGTLVQFDPLWNSTADSYKVQMVSPNDGSLWFRNQNSGVWGGWQQFILANSSGYVGIGTTSPSAPLEVNGAMIRTVAHNQGASYVYATTSGILTGRSLTFTKNKAGSTLYIRYAETRGVAPSASNGQCTWEVKIDGSSCSPTALISSVYADTSFAIISPGTTEGYCSSVGAGSHTLTVVISSNNATYCYNGQGGASWALSEEEVN
jgi:hypothetical protein